MNHTMLKSKIAIVDGERLKELGVLVFEFANRHFRCTERMSRDTSYTSYAKLLIEKETATMAKRQ